MNTVYLFWYTSTWASGGTTNIQMIFDICTRVLKHVVG